MRNGYFPVHFDYRRKPQNKSYASRKVSFILLYANHAGDNKNFIFYIKLRFRIPLFMFVDEVTIYAVVHFIISLANPLFVRHLPYGYQLSGFSLIFDREPCPLNVSGLPGLFRAVLKRIRIQI